MAKLDYDKIFIKEACPTAIGGQAIMEGVMMQGPDRLAIAMRMPSGELYLKTKMKPQQTSAMKIPLVRGVVAFARSLVSGMSTLMESADLLEKYAPEEYAEKPGKLETWINNKFGPKAAWNFLMATALALAVLIAVVFFVILPTWAVNFLGKAVSSPFVLNLAEGILRILMFVVYVACIRNMKDIKTLFRYHGAEHKTIHCFENGLELTPENARQFSTLHPRCGTSFLVFVLIVSLLLFSFLGWPNLLWRILSRLLLIPVIAGISFELLKWAGRSDGKLVRVLSWPGLMLQKLTTAEPNRKQLEVAILSLKAVLVDPETPVVDGFVDTDANPVVKYDDEDMFRFDETGIIDFSDIAEAQGEAGRSAETEEKKENSAHAPDPAREAYLQERRHAEEEVEQADREEAAFLAELFGGDPEEGSEYSRIMEDRYSCVLREDDVDSYEDFKAPEDDDDDPVMPPEEEVFADDFADEDIDVEPEPAAEEPEEVFEAEEPAPAAEERKVFVERPEAAPEQPAADEAAAEEPDREVITDEGAVMKEKTDAGQEREIARDTHQTILDDELFSYPDAEEEIRLPEKNKPVDLGGSGPESLLKGDALAAAAAAGKAASEKVVKAAGKFSGLLSGLKGAINKVNPNNKEEKEEIDDYDLWTEGSTLMSRKMPEGEEVADEEAINEAIRFLSDLETDGYTIVTPPDQDAKSLAQGIADHFTEEAKIRTIARRYTNDIKTIENALKWGQAALSLVENGKSEALMIMSYATGLTHAEIITRGKELMRDEDFRVFDERIQARLTGTPIQYILGMTEFMGMPFRVNPSVLIPRFDTEVVVEKALDIIREKGWERPDVLDMCTGCGAIGISIAAKVPLSIVTMSDISDNALHTAMANAGINGVNKRCLFYKGDMFDSIPEDKVYDIIVCNPPYIESDMIDTLSVEVRDHEPREALDGGKDGLDFYRIIADRASGHLRTGGMLVLEIGSEQAGAVKRLLMKARTWDKIHKEKDLAGLDRVIIAERR